MNDAEKPNVFRFNIQPPMENFVGRKNELEFLTKQLLDCHHEKTIGFVNISGCSGIGKSELARNVAQIFQETFTGHCIWIDGSTNQSLSQCFHTLASEVLQISLEDDSGGEKPLRQVVKSIYERLFNEKALIIIDNVDSHQQYILNWLKDFVSGQQSESKPFLLFTSKVTNFGNCIQVTLEGLEKESARRIFAQSFNIPTNDGIFEIVDQLNEFLKHHPLAIQNAIAYIRKNTSNSDLETKLKDYFTAILTEETKIQVLDHKSLEDENENEAKFFYTVYLTWRLLFHKIIQTPEIGHGAIVLMNVISFFSLENISPEFLLIAFQKIQHGNSIDKFIPILNDHSMINLQGNKISVHHLVQKATMIGLRDFPEVIDQLLSCMHEMLMAKEIPSDQMDHIYVLWQNTLKYPELIPLHGEFPSLICWTLCSFARYKDAYDFCCQSISQLQKILGEDSRHVLKMLQWKGIILRERGKFENSLEMLKRLYKKQKLLFGEESEDCCGTAREIRVNYFKMKKYSKALNCYSVAVQNIEKLHGKEHSLTLALKHDMSLALYKLGKYDEAMRIGKEVFDIEERLLGEEHFDTLSTKHNLALIRFARKEFHEALITFQQVYEVRKSVLDENDPYILVLKYWMALTLKSLQKYNEGLALANEVHKQQLKILGPHNSSTVLSKNLVSEIQNCANRGCIVM